MTVALSVFKTSKEPFWDQLCLADYIWPVDHITYNAVDARRSNLGSVTHKKSERFVANVVLYKPYIVHRLQLIPKWILGRAKNT